MPNKSSEPRLDRIFYVRPQTGKDWAGNPVYDKSKVVAAKFLVVNGAPVVDPHAGGSSIEPLFTSLNADGTANESSKVQNSQNYLIVPANYNPSEAIAFATGVNEAMILGSAENPAIGLADGLGLMTENFLPGGGQDLQRGRKWGVPDGEVAPAFKDAASWNLGFITELTAIPNVFAEIGGGALNIIEYDSHKKTHKPPNGPFGLDKADGQNFQGDIHSAQISIRRGFGELYEDILAIGHWLHESIAPIKGPPGRSYGPRRLGTQANNSESTAPGSPTRDFGYAHHYMAEDAGASADTIVPHAALSSFHQIGNAALGTGTIGTPAQGKITPGHTEFWALQGHGAGFDHIVTALAPYLRDFHGFMGPHSPVGGVFQNAPRLSPLMEREALPSIAPIGRRARDDISAEQFTSHFLDPAKPAEQKYSAPVVGAEKKIDPRALRGALEELLERQGRLPPSGASAFDPLLTPAWPGLQLPA